MQNSNDPLVRNLALILLCMTSFGFGTVSVIHYLSPNPRILDLTLPPINFLINLSLVIHLYKNPSHLRRVFRIWLLSSLVTLTISVWYFTLKVTLSDNLSLSEELPPLSPALLIIYMGLAVFENPDELLGIAVSSWLLIALPVLTYLVVHPSDLFTPRGTELFVMFGPAMIFALVLFEFNKVIGNKITSLHDEREQMERLAIRDPLTHLYNRRGMNNIFDDLFLAEGSKAGVILFDIDRFKNINDCYGHDIGDMVLFNVARRCQKVLKKEALIARWGGEEFLVLIQNAREEILLDVAEDLRLAISANPIGPIGKVTASFGVTQFNSKDSIHTSIKRADEAMYAAKQQGRDRVVWRE